MQASQGPIALERSGSGQVVQIELASSDAIAGILTRLAATAEPVSVRQFGHRIHGNSHETLYRQSDGCCWVLHKQLTPTNQTR